jgi:SNF2 family DNA or RNA helicase
MQFINPNILGMLFFAEHYKVPIEKKQDKLVCGTKNLVSPFILRRTRTSFKRLTGTRNKFSIVIWNPNKRNYTKKKSQKREMHS